MQSKGFVPKVRAGVIILLLLVALPTAAQAANHFVRAGATGSGSGSDWTNAYLDLPASLVRGDTYYVAAGNYGSHTFADADSGTAVITIKAASVADHGTDTGWSNSFVGQATFQAPIYFTSDYYTFNGVYRANTGQPWVDWRNQSSYGFAVNNNNGSNCPLSNLNNATALQVGNLNGADPGANSPANNITIEYVNVIGAGNLSQAGCGNGLDWGLDVNNWPNTTTNFYLGYSYVHDTAADNLLIDGVNGATIEYTYIDRSSEGSASNHMEETAIRNNTDNLMYRYNFIGACGDTACFATPDANGARSNWYIYGNILFVNTAEEPVAYESGDGSFSIFSLSSLTTAYFVNNTISNLSTSGACGMFPWSPVTTTNVFVENNLWFSCPQNNGPATNSGVTWDYQAYYQSSAMCSNDASAHAACSSTNPFANVAQSAGANNFNLTADTAPGSTGDGTNSYSALPPGCTANVNCMNVDMNGTIRGSNGTWDRGALQLTGGTASNPPAAPTGLTASVQ